MARNLFKATRQTDPGSREVEQRHHVIVAVMVFILLGAFTILERFVFFYKENIGITFGLAFAETVQPSWFAAAVGIAVGILLIVAGVFAGFYRIWLPVLMFIVLVVDLIAPVRILLNTLVRQSLPQLVIIAIRLACLKWLAQGVAAIYRTQERLRKSHADPESGRPDSKKEEQQALPDRTHATAAAAYPQMGEAEDSDE